ncbi:MAG: hypothetical protein HY851_09380 [candidate division Zixibacteria bacterium]|nr:hypothetical protein [candidate division Zixibacteria bacterium]
MTSDRKQTGILVVLLILFSLPIWTVAYPPLSDYPSHLLSIFIGEEYHNPAFNFADNFVVDWKPLPNLGSEIIISLLSKILPIDMAGRVYLTGCGILFILSIFYFMNAIDPRKKVLGFFGFLFWYNWYFHQGYINFYGSLPFYFFALGLWLRSVSLSGLREKSLLGVLLVGVFFFHLISWLAIVGSVVVLALWDVSNRKKLANTAVALVPSLLLVIYYFVFLRGGASTSMGAQFLNPYDTATFVVAHTFVDFSKWDLLLYLLPIGLVGILFVRDHIVRPASADRPSRKLFWLAVCLVAAMFILPLQISGVWPFNARLNLFIIMVALASLSATTVDQFKKPLLVVAIVCSLACLGNVWWHYRRMAAQIETYVSGVTHIEPNKNILPLTVDVSGGWKHSPMSTVWAYYHMKKGGAGPYLFDLPHGQVVNYRHPKREQFPAPTLYPPRPADYKADEHARPYDYVLLWGADSSIQEELARNFQPIFNNLRLTVYRKNGS